MGKAEGRYRRNIYGFWCPTAESTVCLSGRRGGQEEVMIGLDYFQYRDVRAHELETDSALHRNVELAPDEPLVI